jgi:hypothetical protein
MHTTTRTPTTNTTTDHILSTDNSVSSLVPCCVTERQPAAPGVLPVLPQVSRAGYQIDSDSLNQGDSIINS